MEVQGLKLENNDGNLKVSPIPFWLNLQVPVTLLLEDNISQQKNIYTCGFTIELNFLSSGYIHPLCKEADKCPLQTIPRYWSNMKSAVFNNSEMLPDHWIMKSFPFWICLSIFKKPVNRQCGTSHLIERQKCLLVCSYQFCSSEVFIISRSLQIKSSLICQKLCLICSWQVVNKSAHQSVFQQMSLGIPNLQNLVLFLQ